LWPHCGFRQHYLNTVKKEGFYITKKLEDCSCPIFSTAKGASRLKGFAAEFEQLV
jgi:hypothetical protein